MARRRVARRRGRRRWPGPERAGSCGPRGRSLAVPGCQRRCHHMGGTARCGAAL